MQGRFSWFVAASLGLHAAVFVGSRWKAHPPPAPVSSGSSTGTGSSAAIGGETFDVPEVEELPASEAPGVADELDAPSPTVPSAPTVNGPAESTAPMAASPSTHRGHHASPSSAPPPPPALYGAVGDRGASNLVAAFKRAFSTAASADPLWDHVPVGFYADGDVTFTLESDGTLAHATASAGSATAFRAAVGRTVAMLKHRIFTAKGAVTRLHVVLRVTDQLVNHGAFTIDAAGSFELPSGRHVSAAITER